MALLAPSSALMNSISLTRRLDDDTGCWGCQPASASKTTRRSQSWSTLRIDEAQPLWGSPDTSMTMRVDDESHAQWQTCSSSTDKPLARILSAPTAPGSTTPDSKPTEANGSVEDPQADELAMGSWLPVPNLQVAGISAKCGSGLDLASLVSAHSTPRGCTPRPKHSMFASELDSSSVSMVSGSPDNESGSLKTRKSTPLPATIRLNKEGSPHPTPTSNTVVGFNAMSSSGAALSNRKTARKTSSRSSLSSTSHTSGLSTSSGKHVNPSQPSAAQPVSKRQRAWNYAQELAARKAGLASHSHGKDLSKLGLTAKPAPTPVTSQQLKSTDQEQHEDSTSTPTTTASQATVTAPDTPELGPAAEHVAACPNFLNGRPSVFSMQPPPTNTDSSAATAAGTANPSAEGETSSVWGSCISSLPCTPGGSLDLTPKAKLLHQQLGVKDDTVKALHRHLAWLCQSQLLSATHQEDLERLAAQLQSELASKDKLLKARNAEIDTLQQELKKTADVLLECEDVVMVRQCDLKNERDLHLMTREGLTAEKAAHASTQVQLAAVQRQLEEQRVKHEADVAELQQQANSTQAAQQKLCTNLRDVTGQYEELMAAIRVRSDTAAAERDSLARELIGMRLDSQSLAAGKDALSSQLSVHMSQLLEASEAFDDAEAKSVAGRSGCLEVLDQMISHQAAAYQELSHELAATKQALQDTEAAKQELTAALAGEQAAHSSTQSALQEVTTSLAAAEATKQELTAALAAEQAALTSEQASHSSTQSALQEVTSSLAAAEATKQELTAALAAEQAALTSEQAAHSSTQSALQEATTSLAAAEATKQELTSALAAEQAALTSEQAAHSSTQSALQEATTSLAAAEATKQELTAALAAEQAALTSEQAAHSSTQSALQEVTASLAAAEATKQELTAALAAEQAALTSEQAAHSSTQSALQEATTSLAAAEATKQELTSALAAEQAALTSEQAAHSSTQSALQEATTSLAAAEATKQELTAALAAEQAALTSEQAAHSSTQSALQEATTSLATAEATKQELTAALAAEQTAHGNTQQAIEAMSQQMQAMQEHLQDQIESVRSSVQEDTHRLQDLLTQAQSALITLHSELATAQDAAHMKDQQIAALQEQVASLSSALAAQQAAAAPAVAVAGGVDAAVTSMGGAVLSRQGGSGGLESAGIHFKRGDEALGSDGTNTSTCGLAAAAAAAPAAQSEPGVGLGWRSASGPVALIGAGLGLEEVAGLEAPIPGHAESGVDGGGGPGSDRLSSSDVAMGNGGVAESAGVVNNTDADLPTLWRDPNIADEPPLSRPLDPLPLSYPLPFDKARASASALKRRVANSSFSRKLVSSVSWATTVLKSSRSSSSSGGAGTCTASPQISTRVSHDDMTRLGGLPGHSEAGPHPSLNEFLNLWSTNWVGPASNPATPKVRGTLHPTRSYGGVQESIEEERKWPSRQASRSCSGFATSDL